MKKVLIILLAIFFIIFLIRFLEGRKNSPNFSYNSHIKIGNTKLYVEIADTEEKRTLGLGGRKNLPQNAGMLFSFKIPAKYSFWMKDMNFPLDIIWVSENKKITAISKNISPNTYPSSFSPSEVVKYVVEVNARWAENNKINAGDIVEF